MSTLDDLLKAAQKKGSDTLKGIAEGTLLSNVGTVGGLLGKALLPEGVKVNAKALEPQPGDSPEVLTMKALIREEQAAQPTTRELVRNRINASQEKAAADSPWLFGAGEMGGALLPIVAATVASGGAAAPAALAQRAATEGGWQLARRAGAAATVGGLEGAVTAAGKSKAEPLRSKEGRDAFLRDVGVGGLVGGAIGGGLPVLGAGLGRAANWAAELEPIRRLKALGFTGTDLKNLGREWQGRARELGQWAKERRLVPWLGNEDVIDSNVAQVLNRQGPVIGEQLQRVAERPDPIELIDAIRRRHNAMEIREPTSQRLQGPETGQLLGDIQRAWGFQDQPTARALAARAEMERRVANAERQLAAGQTPTQQAERVMQRLQREAQETEFRPTRDLSLVDLNSIKGNIQDQTNYLANTASEGAANQARMAAASDARNQVRTIAERNLSPEDWAALNNAWTDYGNAEQVASVLRGRMAQREGQATMPLSAWLSAIGTGAATGNPLAGALAGAGQKIAKHRGDAILANLQGAVSSPLGRNIAASATHPYLAQYLAMRAAGSSVSAPPRPDEAPAPEMTPGLEPEPTQPAEPPFPSVETAPPAGPVEASTEPAPLDFEAFKAAKSRRAQK